MANLNFELFINPTYILNGDGGVLDLKIVAVANSLLSEKRQ